MGARPVRVALLCALAVAACKKRPERPAPTVTLEQPGGGDKRELRLHPAAGTSQAFTMTMRMRMHVSIEGQGDMTVVLPPIRAAADMTIASVAKNGDIRYEFTFVDFEVLEDKEADAGASAALASAITDLKEVSGWAVVSDHGAVRDADIKLPKDAPASLQQTMSSLTRAIDQISPILPEEPVGPGARWRVSLPMTYEGLHLTQEAVMNLESIDQEVITLNMELTQSAVPQTFTPPNMPKGAKVELQSLESKGHGRLVFNLTKVAPVSGKLTIHSAMRTNVSMGGGQHAAMAMDLDADAEFASK